MVLQAVQAQRGSFCNYIANHPHDTASFTVLTTGVLNAAICLKQGNQVQALGFLIAGSAGALILHLDKIVQIADRYFRT